MIYIGIDVAKDKHDCFAMNSDGEILIEKLTIQNNFDGFNSLFNSIFQFNENFENIKVGLEATGHYSNNILNFLTSKGFNVYVINPLQTNLYRKGQSLRKTKTDKLDARFIATMLITDNLKPYSNLSYHILPSAKDISECNLKHLTNILQKHSCGKYTRDKAIEIRDLARKSIGTYSHSLSFELK